MYNSILVGMLVKISRFTASQYDNSFLARCVRKINRTFKSLSKGSFAMDIFTNPKSNIETSIVFKVYSMVIGLLNIISDWMRKVIHVGKGGSISYSFLYSNFKDLSSFFSTISIFTLSLGIGIIGVGIIKGESIVNSIIIGFALSLLSVFILISSNRSKEIISNSSLFRLIDDVFSVDEGGNQWW